MKSNLFQSFAEMIDNIPAEAVPIAVELESRMLEEDLAHHRILSLTETISILSFCRFIGAILGGDNILPAVLPKAHIAFYRKTVMRLVEIGKLPFKANEEFDHVFLPVRF
jgi:hypothetical protein